MRRLYLDMDGVLADFDSHFPACFNCDHYDMPKKEMWRHIYGKEDFFSTIPPFLGAREFVIETIKIAGHMPPILTACPSSNYHHVAKQKRLWVRNMISPLVEVLPVNGSESKPLFMHAEGDVLIDDWGKNCEAWEAAGGVAIKHEHNYGETLEKLRSIWND